MKLLLVDPSPIVRKSIVTMLGDQVTCYAASTAHQAIELLDTHEVECALINPNLSSNSGLELLYEMNSYSDLKSIRTALLTDKPEVYMQHRMSLRELGVELVLPRSSLSQASLEDALEHLSQRVLS